MKEDAPLLHADLVTDSMGDKAENPSNIPVHLHFEKGDAGKAFEEPMSLSNANSKRRPSIRGISNHMP